jgi:hypothetical protein
MALDVPAGRAVRVTSGGADSPPRAGDDWTAILYSTGTYTPPWIH